MTSFAAAINDALVTAMTKDAGVIVYGLGAEDPKGIFGTNLGLKERFGGDRVFDMPTSENAMTGVAIGAALNGIKPVMTHQRFDFFFLAMDQLVNNAAKWHYMFGGQQSVPITVRLIIGRGWGNGPTHTQNLQSWFLQVPGLKVVCPTFPADAKGLLLSAIFDPNPVVYIEHRWLHQQEGQVPEGDVRIPLGQAHLLREGRDVTIVSHAYMTLEALKAMNFLVANGISAELIDLRTIHPIDWDTIFASVRKTSRLLVLDTSFSCGGIGSEIIAQVAQHGFAQLSCPPRLIGLPNGPVPTSPALTEGFYPDSNQITRAIFDMLGKSLQPGIPPLDNGPHDVPGAWFKGPF